MLLIISLSLFLTLISSVQSADLLSQPEAETGRPGGSLRLTCKASGFSVDGYSMYWIQQIPGQGLEWLLHYYSPSTNNYAPAIKDRFTAFKDISNNIFGLDMKLLKTEDTAMYYCGVYYSNWAVALQL
ncbi:hypothetical protein chiPu_0011260 [Chiloscyllium punctatum]|uniref:Ig-like domain-containing protein n=1 Tax=Chiloscyllium punctatum TaxID=137246 RepID=A0A401SR04_CHIPU|nr:hypothetical protein [Chiloscyllium punctatum]